MVFLLLFCCVSFSPTRPAFNFTHFRASLLLFQQFHNSFFLCVFFPLVIRFVFFPFSFGFTIWGEYFIYIYIYIQNSRAHANGLKTARNHMHVFQGIVLKIRWYVCSSYSSLKFVRCYVLSTSCVLVQRLWFIASEWIWQYKHASNVDEAFHQHALFELKFLRAFRFQALFAVFVHNAFLSVCVCMWKCVR